MKMNKLVIVICLFGTSGDSESTNCPSMLPFTPLYSEVWCGGTLRFSILRGIGRTSSQACWIPPRHYKNIYNEEQGGLGKVRGFPKQIGR